MNFNSIVKEEVDKMVLSLGDQISDPIQKAALVRMTMDLSMLPIRMANGEDVTNLTKSLKAEAALRGVVNSLKAQEAVKQAWINIIMRIVITALAVSI